MTDTRSPEQRRRIMQAVKSKDTGPEWAVRRVLFAKGYRYRLYPKTLPGRPDVAFPARKKAIFVHGCYWHGHGCAKGRLPKSRLDYWGPKIEENKRRDARKIAELEAMGWRTTVVWECEIKDMASLEARLVAFLENPIDNAAPLRLDCSTQ